MTTSVMTFPEVRLRPRRALLAGGLTLGFAAEVLLDGAPFGLGHALFSVSLAAVLITLGGREIWQSAREHRGLLLQAVLLVSSTMLHDAYWLGVLCTLTAGVLFSLALLGWNGSRALSSAGLGALLAAPFSAFGNSVKSGVQVTSSELRETNVTAQVRTHFPALVRLGFIVVPPLLLVTVLLASGDAIFRAKLDALFDAAPALGRGVRGALFTLCASLVLTGVLAFATRRREHLETSAPKRSLTSLETGALLGSLTLLLVAFGVLSTPCALAPAACALPKGVTYADAAHEGFFQLLFAAMSLLALLMALPARTQLGERALKALSTALVLATMPMLVSATARLWRYETTYGLTVLRLMAYAGLAFVAAMLAWRALTLWVAPQKFVSGALALLSTTLLSLAVLSPERFIAEHNVEMVNGAVAVDVAYLQTLSADAVPTLRRLGVEPLSTPAPDSWLTWNLGRARALSR